MIGGYEPGRPGADVLRGLNSPDAVIGLSSNENPLGASPYAVRALQSAAVHVYPDPQSDPLRQRLAALHEVDPAQIAVGPGTTDLIYHLVRLCGGPVLAPPHTFVAYRLAAQVADLAYDERPLERIGADARTICLANPGNPTGHLYRRDELEALLERIPRQATAILDEAYREYLDPALAADVSIGRGHPNVVILRTFSKAHGLAALRIGYAVGSVELIARLDAARPPFSVPGPAQAAALAALDDAAHVRTSRLLVERGRVQLRDGLDALGISVPEGHGNFLLVPFGPRARAVYDGLLRAGVLVRRLEPYGLPEHLRVTIGTADQNGRFLEALARVWGG